MNKGTQIIQFPRRNDRQCSVSPLQRQGTATHDMREKPPAIGDPASAVTGLAANELPQIPDFHDLMGEQCDLLVGAMQALVGYIEDRGEETAGKLRAIWKRGDEIKKRHLGILELASPKTIGRYDIFRSVVTLDMAIHCAQTTTRHILDLGLVPDQFILEMAIENKNCAQALQKGFNQLRGNPFQAEEYVHTVHRVKRNVEKIHRHALAELVDDDEMLKAPKTNQDNMEAMSDIFRTYERREIYHYLSKSAKRIVWAANCLREIVAYSAPHNPATKEPIG